MIHLIPFLAASLVASSFAETPKESTGKYHVMRLQDNCNCEPGTYKVILRYANNDYRSTHVNSDGTILIPKQSGDMPQYSRITGVSVISKATRPNPYRLTKLCPGMPHLPDQAHWVEPYDKGLIPMHCERYAE